MRFFPRAEAPRTGGIPDHACHTQLLGEAAAQEASKCYYVGLMEQLGHLMPTTKQAG